ncbi:MAG: hypothetical protein FJX35_11630 [Alphaproteobacteria bacterium]|nr:hypothetical protein [Alphaproteobacteria bacterium]
MINRPVSAVANFSADAVAGDRWAGARLRAARSARDFQASAIASLLKPLAPALMGQSSTDPSDGFSREFFGFLLIENLARQMADGDALRINVRLKEGMERTVASPTPDGAQS